MVPLILSTEFHPRALLNSLLEGAPCDAGSGSGAAVEVLNEKSCGEAPIIASHCSRVLMEKNSYFD